MSAPLPSTIVSLPMYDWPEVSGALDRLWAAIRTALAQFGIDAPSQRSRPEESVHHWRDPSLLVSQTCGLPLRRRLTDDVVVIGAFDHRLPATAPGDYHSVLIVGADHPAASLRELHQATAAINGADSQSGHAALRHALIDTPAAVSDAVVSGSHRASIELVASGAADIAAIDAVSWELALAHEPTAAQCRVIGRTDPTPGLPLTTAKAHAPSLPELRGAVALGVAAIDDADRRALHAHALVAVDADDYAELDERWSAADHAGVPEFA